MLISVSKTYRLLGVLLVGFIRQVIMPLDPITVARILALIQDGRGQRETARIVGKNLRAVQNAYQRYQKTGPITRRQGSGRKSVTTQRNDRLFGVCKLTE